MIKKRVLVEAQNNSFELWIPNIEEELKGGIKMATVSELIAQTLKERGVSQAFLSEKTGIPYKRINYIVTENGDVKNDEIFKIADALNVDVNFFNPRLRNFVKECQD